MKIIMRIIKTFAIIGSINMFLIGFFQFDIISAFLGISTIFSRTIFVLCGICGLSMVIFYKPQKPKKKRKKKEEETEE